MRSRRYPSREQVIRRRIAAMLFLAAGIGIGIWVAAEGLNAGKSNRVTPPTTLAPPKEIRVTFPEGWTRAQMAARAAARLPGITKDAYLAVTRSGVLPKGFEKPRDLEGFLFPDTYFVFENDPAKALAEKQLDNFGEKWAKVNLRYAHSKQLTPYDVLIIASMIEKEVRIPTERRLVAAVIYNRLHARIPLGIDATLRYGLKIPATKSITLSDLDSDSPYNTRKFQGLPPTPIANPGISSIRAAARPANVDYLYFIRKPDCKHHFFTSSLEAFNNYTREGLQKPCQ
jgi:peptidoglycan lytic transglycosylase G